MYVSFSKLYDALVGKYSTEEIIVMWKALKKGV